MPDVVQSDVERVKLSGIVLKDLLNQDFIKAMEQKGLAIDFVHLHALIPVEEGANADEKKPIHILFEHDNKKEIEQRVMHIEASQGQHLDAVKNLVLDFFKGKK